MSAEMVCYFVLNAASASDGVETTEKMAKRHKHLMKIR